MDEGESQVAQGRQDLRGVAVAQPLVIGRVERPATINGVALSAGQHVALSVTGLRSVNHHYAGLLFQVSDDAERDAAQFPVAVRCIAGRPLQVEAD